MSGVEIEQENLSAQPPAQGGRGRWLRLGVLWRWLGTSGGISGTNGEALRSYLWGLGVLSAMVLAFNIVNVTTDIHDIRGISPIEPIIWEGSSWFTLTLFAVIPWAALQAAPFSVRPRWKFPSIHLPALLLFSLLHVAGFIAIRKGIYAAAGAHYGTGVFTDFWYEFRKDCLSYTLGVLVFWSVARHFALQALPRPGDVSHGTFDIRDGARLTRVRLGEILAVTSAGNYVEFVLEDGRRPLMRSPLSAMEAELAPRGFVRTHRSWLVNGAKISGLAPEGSGDYRIELGGLVVPLSRRFPGALAALRGEAPTSPLA